MPPKFPRIFGRGKEGPPSGGGRPPVAESPLAHTSPVNTLDKTAKEPERQLSLLEIAREEADTAFSTFMDDLELAQKQNPEEPFFVRFGWAKGEKNPESTSAQDKEARIDSRVLVLISPDDKDGFTLITRRVPKRIEPQGRMTKKDIKEIIDHILNHGQGNYRGGFFADVSKTTEVHIGYNSYQGIQGRTNKMDAIFVDVELVEPSLQEVLDRIQASRELAHARAEETQKPLRDAQETARKNKEAARKLSEFLKTLSQLPAGEGSAAPPSTPTA